jgi:hypothetical protein
MTHSKDNPTTEGGWWKPLAWFGLILVGFWVLWYYTGGPARYESTHPGQFLRPLEPLDTGDSYGPGH